MAKHKMIFSSSICLLIAFFVGQSLSLASRVNRTGDSSVRSNRIGSMRPEERRRAINERRREYEEKAAKRREQRRVERERQLSETRVTAGKRSDESIKQALGATEDQWKVIEPKFKKVRSTMREARVSIAPMSFTAAGSAGSARGVGIAGGSTGGSAGAGGGSWGGAGGSSGAGGSAGGFGISSAGGRSRAGSGQMSSKETYSEETRSWNQSGWKWLKPSESKSPSEMTEGEKACEELLELLQNKDSNPAAIGQKLDALRNIREKAGKQLIKAQQELRKVLTDRQEATLVLMGWLD